MLRAILDGLRKHDSAFWRRAIHAGVTWGPDFWVRYSPPVFGLAFAAALPKHRRAVEENLRRALGPRPRLVEIADAARVFATYASCLTEAFIAGSDRGDEIRGHVTGDEHFASALGAGKGVLLATAHAGGWQVAGAVLRREHPADLLIVMRRERDEGAQRLQDEARDRAGVSATYMGDHPLDALPLIHHLRRGGVVAVQIDRVPEGMRARRGALFGDPWDVPEGPLMLASLSGAPILPAFTRRVGYMEYEVLVGAPIYVPKRATSADLDAGASALLRAMERFVRDNPTQWFHFE